MAWERRTVGRIAIGLFACTIALGSSGAAAAASRSNATIIKDEAIALVHDATGTDHGSASGVCKHLVYDPTKKDKRRCSAVMKRDKLADPRFHTPQGRRVVAEIVSELRHGKVTFKGNSATLHARGRLPRAVYQLKVVNNTTQFQDIQIYQKSDWVASEPGY